MRFLIQVLDPFRLFNNVSPTDFGPLSRVIFFDKPLLSFLGQAAIMQKLKSLSFTTVKHITTTVDGQPTVDGGMVIHVMGQLKTDNDAPHTFSETFYLKQKVCLL